VIVGIDARELQGRPTGVGRYLRSLLRRWPERDPPDRLVVYFNGPAPADDVLREARVVCRTLAAHPVRGLVFQEALLPRALERDAVDVVFAPGYTCPLRTRRPRVTAVHDLSYFARPQDFGFLDGLRRRLFVAASVRASRRIVAISAFTRREIAARFPDAADRVVLVPVGRDDDLPAPPPRAEARARLGLGGPLVLTVGTVLNRRHLPDLIQAVALLSRRHPHLVLEVVGDNRTHPYQDLAACAARAGVGRRVRLSGFVTEEGLAARYAAADVAVFLSEYEGFGLPALEAAARGVPLVVSRRPALGETFAGAALLVDPGDAAGVAEAVGRVLADVPTRAGLVARGEALADRHSWEEAARLTRDALAQAAGIP
jgi:glycosyltransferase involved in cell wall biosynthesis